METVNNKNIYGAIVTNCQPCSSGRDTTHGNTATIKKFVYGNETLTCISSVSFKFAVRMYWQLKGLSINRKWNDQTFKNEMASDSYGDFELRIDDTILGFMVAEAGKKKGEGTCVKRRSIFNMNQALSLRSYDSVPHFHVATPGSTKSTDSPQNSMIYAEECNHTEYQFPFYINTRDTMVHKYIPDLLSALISLNNVSGGNNNYYYNFFPHSIVFRYTEDFNPAMDYIFNVNNKNIVQADELIRLIQARDVRADELYIGGKLSSNEEIKQLVPKDNLFLGVKDCTNNLIEMFKKDFNLT